MSEELRTLDVKPKKDTMVKAGELVDVVEVTPLTLTDRKIYNLLIDNAKQAISKPVEHVIDKDRLRQSRRGNEQVDDSILRLMGGIVQIRTEHDGEPATIRVPLLGRNIEHDRHDGKFYYTFDPELRNVLDNSNVFARLKINVMLAFTGKYGLALYEMIEKRVNLRKSEEIISIAQFRNLLGVPKGKLTTWHNLKTRAIDPAVAEVNQLATDFRVEVTGLKTGRSFNEVKLKWWRTAPDGEESAIAEHLRPKVGRKARREGTVENVFIEPLKLEYSLSEAAKETAREILLKGSKRMGLQTAIYEWEQAFKDKERPNNPDGAFINFCKKIA
ncbi:replication initiation protein [Teredinibacter turnerae]|uniref:replication initiation protein n=1 Tax=Teredinibacter turnerae TaxID=2426 RepID=UPI00055EA9B3|nr:replication initiation protein [Teredinibacter turnerae]